MTIVLVWNGNGKLDSIQVWKEGGVEDHSSKSSKWTCSWELPFAKPEIVCLLSLFSAPWKHFVYFWIIHSQSTSQKFCVSPWGNVAILCLSLQASESLSDQRKGQGVPRCSWWHMRWGHGISWENSSQCWNNQKWPHLIIVRVTVKRGP